MFDNTSSSHSDFLDGDICSTNILIGFESLNARPRRLEIALVGW